MWWAGQDSNLQPDRYERPALTVELPAPAGLDQSRVLAWTAGPSRTSAIQPKEKNSRPTPRSFRTAFGITPGSAHKAYFAARSNGRDRRKRMQGNHSLAWNSAIEQESLN